MAIKERRDTKISTINSYKKNIYSKRYWHKICALLLLYYR